MVSGRRTAQDHYFFHLWKRGDRFGASWMGSSISSVGESESEWKESHVQHHVNWKRCNFLVSGRTNRRKLILLMEKGSWKTDWIPFRLFSRTASCFFLCSYHLWQPPLPVSLLEQSTRTLNNPSRLGNQGYNAYRGGRISQSVVLWEEIDQNQADHIHP